MAISLSSFVYPPPAQCVLQARHPPVDPQAPGLGCDPPALLLPPAAGSVQGVLAGIL